jgi:hypothetical protein
MKCWNKVVKRGLLKEIMPGVLNEVNLIFNA